MAGRPRVGLRLALGFVLAVGLVSLVGCKKKPVPAVEVDPPVVVAPLPTVPPIAPLLPAAATMPDAPAGSASARARSLGSSTLEKAMEAAAEGRSADVRRLLEAKVRSGHGSVEEMRLVRKACSSPPDKACLADIKAKYP